MRAEQGAMFFHFYTYNGLLYNNVNPLKEKEYNMFNLFVKHFG